MKRLALFIVFFILVLHNNAQKLFPENSGVIDVTKAPYNAKGDGATDDTEAIQQALDAYPNGSRVIYLPPGTYLISDRLDWPTGSHGGHDQKRTTLQGAGIDHTILKLKDNATLFQGTDGTKAMIWTGNSPAQRFGNHIFDLTVSTGKGNPGAIGVQFNSSNQGAMRNVKIIDEDNQAKIGLDMGFTDEIGPLLIKNVTIEGFETGINSWWQVNSMTFEDITLKNQRLYGLHNYHQAIRVRKLKSINSVPGLFNRKDSWGDVAIIDSEFEGIGDVSGISAIWNQKAMYCRNLDFTGDFQNSINNDDKGRDCGDIQDAHVEEAHSHCNIHTLFPTPEKSLNLPIKEIPEIAWEAPSTWKSPMDFGAKGDGSTDDTKAVQDALNSGATTVYFPGGKKFNLNGTIEISGPVRHIIGLRGQIGGNVTFKLVDQSVGDAPVVVFERFTASVNDNVVMENASSRTFVVSHLLNISARGSGTGDFFINDIVGGALKLTNKDQHVWARAINVEVADEPSIQNNGAFLWVFGYKTEKDGVKLLTTDGGFTEVIGAMIYNNTGDNQKKPFIINTESNVSVQSWSERHFGSNRYENLVEETRDGITKTLKSADKLNGGPFFYVGYQDSVPSVPTVIAEKNPAKIRVYPNPASDMLYIETGTDRASYDVIIYNSVGQVVKNETITSTKKVISISELAKGMYWIKLNSATGPTQIPFVKQ